MAFGTGPFGIVVFGTGETPPPSQALSTLSSSRKIDGVTRRYVLNAEGGFEAMGDVAQRVYCLVTQAAGAEPPFIDERASATVEANIRTSLAPLTALPSPQIAIVSIAVQRTSLGTLSREVVFRTLGDDTEHTVSA